MTGVATEGPYQTGLPVWKKSGDRHTAGRLSHDRSPGVQWLITVCVVVLLTGSCRTSLINPLGSGDPLYGARMSAAVALADNRLVPASAVTGKQYLTLDDCRRLALARNLDLRAARVDELTKEMIRDSSGKKILPHLVWASELGRRDNYGYSFSDVLGQEGLSPNPAAPSPGAGVTNYSVAHERSTWRYSMELNWSPTDALLAYYLTRSGHNDTLRAHFQKVRVAQKLVGTVDTSFYRLLSLQKRCPMAKRLTGIRSRVLEESERLYQEKLVPVEQCHRARQKYLKASRVLLGIEDDLERQRNVMFSALSLSPDRCVDAGVHVTGALVRPAFRECIPVIELTAVRNRPEAQVAGLTTANSINDLTRSLVRCFPKLTGFWRYTRDKDHYLLHKDWKEIGFRVYFDLAEWLSNWDEKKAAKYNVTKMELDGGAVTLGIAVQARMAALSYFRSLKELEYAASALRSSERVLRSARVKHASNDLTKLAFLEVQADTLEEEIDGIRAVGEANAALAELYATMGTNYNERKSTSE